MNDQSQQGTLPVWRNIIIGIAILVGGGILGYFGNDILKTSGRDAQIENLMFEILDMKADINMQFAAAEKNVNMQFAAAEKNVNMQFVAAEKNVNTRFTATEKNADTRFDAINTRFETTDKNTDTRFTDFITSINERFAEFTESIHKLIEMSDKNANARFTEFMTSINKQIVELIKRIETLEEQLTMIEGHVIPSSSDVIKELGEIKSRLIILKDSQSDSVEFREQFVQVQSDFETLSQKVELLLVSNRPE